MVTIALRNKDTQPSPTCSEGYTFLLLHCTGVFLCFWGVLTRLEECAAQGRAWSSDVVLRI